MMAGIFPPTSSVSEIQVLSLLLLSTGVIAVALAELGNALTALFSPAAALFVMVVALDNAGASV